MQEIMDDRNFIYLCRHTRFCLHREARRPHEYQWKHQKEQPRGKGLIPSSFKRCFHERSDDELTFSGMDVDLYGRVSTGVKDLNS
jgi:hypothetical protein